MSPAIERGLHEGTILLDLNYDEDSAIGTDMNFVMTDKGQFVRSARHGGACPFTREQLNKMMDVADKGCRELFIHQAAIIGEIYRLAGK